MNKDNVNFLQFKNHERMYADTLGFVCHLFRWEKSKTRSVYYYDDLYGHSCACGKDLYYISLEGRPRRWTIKIMRHHPWSETERRVKEYQEKGFEKTLQRIARGEF